MTKCFFEFYRCPSDAVRFDIGVGFPSGPGYFRLGEELTIYGKTAGVPGAKYFSDNLQDVLPAIRVNRGEINLPFDPDQVADILRYERYPMEESNGSPRLGTRPWSGTPGPVLSVQTTDASADPPRSSADLPASRTGQPIPEMACGSNGGSLVRKADGIGFKGERKRADPLHLVLA